MTTQHQHKARTKSSSSLNSNFFKKVGIYFKFLFFYVLNKKVVQIMFPITMLVAIIIGLLPLVLFNTQYNAAGTMATSGLIISFIVCFVLGINLGRYTFGDSRNQGTEILILSKPITRWQILVGRFLYLFVFCLVIGIILSVFNTIFLLVADDKVKTYFPSEYETSNLKNFISTTWVSLGICIFGGLLSGFIAVFRNGKILPVLAPLLFFLILLIGLFYPIIVSNGTGIGGADAITNLYNEESKNKIKPTPTGEPGFSSSTESSQPLKAFRGSYDPFSKSESNLTKNAYYQLSDSLNSDVYQKAFSNLTNSASNQAARFFNYINPLGLFIPDIFSGTLGTQSVSLDPIKQKNSFPGDAAGSYTYDYYYDKNSNNYFPTVVNSVDNSSYLIVPSQQINHSTVNYVYLPNNYGIFVEEHYDIPVSLEYHVKTPDVTNFSKIFATSPAPAADYYFSANFLFSQILQTLTNTLLVSDDIQNSLINYFASFGNDKKSISFTDFSSAASKAISDNKDNVLNELSELKTLKAPDDITNWLNEFFSPLIKQIESNSQYSYSSYNPFTESDGYNLSPKQKLLSEISSISELINAITPSNFVLLIYGYAALYFSIFTSYHNVASSIADLNSGTNQGLKLNLSYSADVTNAYDAQSLTLPESLILGAYPKTEPDKNYYWWANSDYGTNFKTKTPKLDPTAPITSSKDSPFNLLGFLGNGTNPTVTDPTSDKIVSVGKSYMEALQDKDFWNASPIEYAPNNQLDKNFWTQDFTSDINGYGYNRNLQTPYTPFSLLPSSQVFILTEVNRSPTWAIALLWTLVSLALIPAICVVFLRRDYLEVNN